MWPVGQGVLTKQEVSRLKRTAAQAHYGSNSETVEFGGARGRRGLGEYAQADLAAARP